MWLSADPAMGEYIPRAPVDDDARKYNQNLPGMGGVFNYINLHTYHYAGNNPVKLVDPTGRESGYVMDEDAVGVFGHAGWFVKTDTGYSFFEVTELPNDVRAGDLIQKEGETKEGKVLSNSSLSVSNWVVRKIAGGKTSAGVVQRDFITKDDMLAYLSAAGDKGGYDTIIEFNTTPKGDSEIYRASIEKGADFSSYALLGNSCGIIARDVLTTQGSGLINVPPLGFGSTLIANAPNDIGDRLFYNNISHAKRYSIKK
jgi:hypothetical protein